MWTDRDGNIYGGQCKPGDRKASHAEIKAYHTGLRDGAIMTCGCLPNADKALLYAAAAMAGKSTAQADAAFTAALGALA